MLKPLNEGLRWIRNASSSALTPADLEIQACSQDGCCNAREGDRCHLEHTAVRFAGQAWPQSGVRSGYVQGTS